MKFIVLILFFVLTQCTTGEKTPEQTAESKVDREGIRQTVLAHKKYIGNCYGRTLVEKGNEDLKGTIMIHFAINPEGKALAPKVVPDRSTINNNQLGQCIMDGIVSWDFPAPTDGKEYTVNYPFVFRDDTPSNMQNKMDRFEKIKKN